MNLIVKRFNELTTFELYEILKSRAEIFIMEQQINYQDMDNIDYDSLHCFFIQNDQIIAYLRAFYSGDDQRSVKLGRVLTLEHGKGLGRDLLEQSLGIIKERMPCEKICMHAQKHAVDFYKKFGFKVVSDEFLEAGVVHVVMELGI